MTPCSEAEIRRGALLIRARPGDGADARPIEPCENVDSSPDLLLLGGRDARTAIVDSEHTVRVRVTNAGAQPIEQINVEAWVCNRSGAPPPLGRIDPPGRMTGYYPGPLEPGGSTLISCSPTWKPTSDALALGDNLCLAANVSSEAPADGAELTEGSILKVCCDTHHALCNIVVRPAKTNIIRTVAGTGVQGFSGDGGQATAAQIGEPFRVAAMADGGFLFSDNPNDCVRMVSRDGTIDTIAGGGDDAVDEDGIGATSASIHRPTGVAVTPDGGFLVAEDGGANRVRRVSSSGLIRTIPVGVQLRSPMGMAATADGGFLIADQIAHRVYRLSPDGTTETAAGTGVQGFGGDGGPATDAGLAMPYGLAVMPDGGFLIADMGNRRIRRVHPDGTISTVAGNGVGEPSGDGGPAIAAAIGGPCGVALAPTGEIVIADTRGSRVRQIDVDGTITTIAGTGEDTPADGDGGLASAARLIPFDVAVAADGAVLIADAAHHVIRRVAAEPTP